MAISQNFPSIVPSLSLNFASSRTLDPRITFTRTSSATRILPDGLLEVIPANSPRFDHNPTTGESLGLLVEEARTNLFLQSENLGTTWTPSAILAFGSGSTLNAATAPDGTSTADLITEDTTTSTHLITQGSLSFTSGTTYTLSCFVKRGTGSRNATIQVRSAAFGSSTRVNIDLLTGATTLTGSGVAFGSQSYPNGWWRVFMTVTATATVISSVDIGAMSGASTLSYTGDGTSGIYLWGAQLETGAFPTSYIPTTTATVTRSADVASITGSAFSSWYRQDKGTIFAEGATSASTGNPVLVSLDDGTSSERQRLLRIGASDTAQYSVTDGGVAQAAPAVTVVFSANTKAKLCGAYAINSFNLALNGTLGTLDTSGTVPTVDRMLIGSHLSGSYLNQSISRITYWPQRLSDSMLQTLTK